MRKNLVFVAALLIGGRLLAQEPDTTFLQPISVKYTMATSLQQSVLKKVVVDDNDVIHVLTSGGLCRISDHAVVKDLLYRPLANRIPVDIAIQEKTGYLYDLYEDAFLSNAEAGIPYGSLPKGTYDQIAVAPDGTVLIAGDHVLGIYRRGKLQPLPWGEDTIISIRSHQGSFYVLSSLGLYRINRDQPVLLHQGPGLKTFAFRANDILLGTANGYYGIGLKNGDTTMGLQSSVPVPDIDRLITVKGNIWAATSEGTFMQAASGSFRYYASKRWLDDDHVVSIAADSHGNVYLLSNTGLNEIKFIPETLLQKADYFEDVIRQRHIRYGLLAETRMAKPGDLSTAEMIDTDNDGLWSAFYLGAEAFRYAVTGSTESRRYAWETFAAFERLVSINPLKGFPARTFERTGYKVSDPTAWRPSPDSGWEWKGTTSSDEFVGHIFIAAVMDEYVAKTKDEKKRVADFMDKILTHILTHHLSFVDADGKATLWGRWYPGYINWYPTTIGDRKLGSTDLIAGLQLGYALTGKSIYKTEALRLLNDSGYLDNIMIDIHHIKPTHGYIYEGHDMGSDAANHSDDEMAFLTYWVLYHYAFNQGLREKYAQAIRNYWGILVPEKNPLWNLIALGTAGSFDKPSTLWYLREFPLDQIRWSIDNSRRKDLIWLKPNFRHQYTRELLSPEEQPVHRYNANPFDLTGGDGGRTALTGAEYLLPYWMARYLKIIKE